MMLHFTGTLRISTSAQEPWRYRGALDLPSGRYCTIRARVVEDDAGRFFQIEGAMEPGMTAAELEVALTRIEAERAQQVRRELDASDELPF